MLFKVPMKIGEDFHLKIQYGEVASEILVTINEVVQIFKSKTDFVTTVQYSVSMGMGSKIFKFHNYYVIKY